MPQLLPWTATVAKARNTQQLIVKQAIKCHFTVPLLCVLQLLSLNRVSVAVHTIVSHTNKNTSTVIVALDNTVLVKFCSLFESIITLFSFLLVVESGVLRTLRTAGALGEAGDSVDCHSQASAIVVNFLFAATWLVCQWIKFLKCCLVAKLPNWK